MFCLIAGSRPLGRVYLHNRDFSLPRKGTLVSVQCLWLQRSTFSLFPCPIDFMTPLIISQHSATFLSSVLSFGSALSFSVFYLPSLLLQSLTSVFLLFVSHFCLLNYTSCFLCDFFPSPFLLIPSLFSLTYPHCDRMISVLMNKSIVCVW